MSITQEEAFMAAIHSLDSAKEGADHIIVTIHSSHGGGWARPHSAAYQNTSTKAEIKLKPTHNGEGVEVELFPQSKFRRVFQANNHMYCDLKYYGKRGHHCISASLIPHNDRRDIPAHITLTIPSTLYEDTREIMRLLSDPLVA